MDSNDGPVNTLAADMISLQTAGILCICAMDEMHWDLIWRIATYIADRSPLWTYVLHLPNNLYDVRCITFGIIPNCICLFGNTLAMPTPMLSAGCVICVLWGLLDKRGWAVREEGSTNRYQAPRQHAGMRKSGNATADRIGRRIAWGIASRDSYLYWLFHAMIDLRSYQ